MLTFLGDVSLIPGTIASEYKLSHPYIFNCEYVIGDSNCLKPVPGKINLISDRCDFKSLFGKDPVAVTLSNNHTNDYGEQGYSQTVACLDEKGIKIAAGKPIWINNICILSYMDLRSSNEGDKEFLFNKKTALSQIVSAKRVSGARIVVCIHWGIENNPNPVMRQVKVAHWLIDHGVDLIIGHHPHCLQKVEKYKGKYIFYSLGNSLFPPINQPSHFTKDGFSMRTYRIKWLKWNRQSYAVTIDDNADICFLEELEQSRTGVLKKKKNWLISDVICKKEKSAMTYFARKYFLFFYSNCFTDGKIFDISAIKAEMSK